MAYWEFALKKTTQSIVKSPIKAVSQWREFMASDMLDPNQSLTVFKDDRVDQMSIKGN